MKAIMVMFDTLNRRMLPPYGCDWTHAPNFARLAQRTVTFDNCYVGSMPCIPARRELHTGRYNFLHRSWGPIEPFDDSMPQILKESGVYTHLVTDHGHYFEDGGATYAPRYSSWELFRGQEGDPWKGEVADPEIPKAVNPRHDAMWRQDWINRKHMQWEDEQPQAKTFRAGLEFIETNHDEDNWFLQIETFDPHEPFFTQKHYQDLYPEDYDGPHFDWPPYEMVSQAPEQVQHLRHQYAALLSMCDRYLGKVIDQMDAFDLWKDTMLIVCTDHGFLLGEHDWWAKVVQPFYQEVAHTPLFIWDPRSKVKGERRSSLTQMIDFAPTLLDFFGVPIPEDMQGASLWQTILDDTPVRDVALFGVHGGHINITDGHYVYMRAPADGNGPLYNYTLMPTHMRNPFTLDELQDIQLAEPFKFTKGCRTMKINANPWSRSYSEFGTMLFDLTTDYDQQKPIENATVEQDLIKKMVKLMQENDAPEEQYARVGLQEYV